MSDAKYPAPLHERTLLNLMNAAHIAQDENEKYVILPPHLVFTPWILGQCKALGYYSHVSGIMLVPEPESVSAGIPKKNKIIKKAEEIILLLTADHNSGPNYQQGFDLAQKWLVELEAMKRNGADDLPH